MPKKSRGQDIERLQKAAAGDNQQSRKGKEIVSLSDEQTDKYTRHPGNKELEEGSPRNEEAGNETDEEDASSKMQKLLLAVQDGRIVLCQWKDGNYYPAKVLETREHRTAGFQCYVHYTEFNRRNDEWVKPGQVKLNYVEDNKKDVLSQGSIMTRQQKRKTGMIEEHEGLDPEELHTHEQLTKVKNINSVQVGRYQMDTWYYSPLPEEYNDCEQLFFCEQCLLFFKHEKFLKKHPKKCLYKDPPGNEIYRTETFSIFEVDGVKHRVYCENLCILAKLFLDHKLVHSNVGMFVFYVLYEFSNEGCDLAAYFSKSQVMDSDENLACILTFPPFQSRGYGKLLIALSYDLSKREGKIGMPERPLSDLGQRSYTSYWKEAILEILMTGERSIKELSEQSAIHSRDIISTLKVLDLPFYRDTIDASLQKVERKWSSLGRGQLKFDPKKVILSRDGLGP